MSILEIDLCLIMVLINEIVATYKLRKKNLSDNFHKMSLNFNKMYLNFKR